MASIEKSQIPQHSCRHFLFRLMLKIRILLIQGYERKNGKRVWNSLDNFVGCLSLNFAYNEPTIGEVTNFKTDYIDKDKISCEM
jgi:hypothetical protein